MLPIVLFSQVKTSQNKINSWKRGAEKNESICRWIKFRVHNIARQVIFIYAQQNLITIQIIVSEFEIPTMKLPASSERPTPYRQSSSCSEQHFSAQHFSATQKSFRTKFIGKKRKQNNAKNKAQMNNCQHDNFYSVQDMSINEMREEKKQHEKTATIVEEQKRIQKQNYGDCEDQYDKLFFNSNIDHRQRLTNKNDQHSNDIFTYLLERESRYVPLAIKDSCLTDEYLRYKLTEWVSKVSKLFTFRRETTFIAINIVDRFLSKKTLQKKKLQLLAITALYMAAKYEQITVPKISNFSGLAPNDLRVTKNNILNLESTILQLLDFDFGYIPPSAFIHLLSSKKYLSKEEIQRVEENCLEMMGKSEYKSFLSSQIAFESLKGEVEDDIRLKMKLISRE